MDTITVRTAFQGIHCWPEAPDSVAFLRNPHRHVFNVEVSLYISESREVEFFEFRNILDLKVIPRLGMPYHFENPTTDLGSMSCEYICKDLHSYLSELDFNVASITVREDEENSATLTF